MGNCQYQNKRYGQTGSMTRLMAACKKQNHALVETVLQSESNKINYRNYIGNSAIHYCFWTNTLNPRGRRENCLRLLIDAGADVNVTTLSGRTPLMFSAKFSLTNCGKLLIKAKANINQIDAEGESVVHYCVNSSIKVRRKDFLKLLLRSSAKCDLQSKDGITPLMKAVQQGDPELVDILLFAGCEVNTSDNEGCTAMHYYYRHTDSYFCRKYDAFELEAVKLLVENGADLNVADHFDQTVFEKALNCLDVETVQYLLHKNCSVRLEDLQCFLKPGFQYKPEKERERVIGLLLIECGFGFRDIDTFRDVFSLDDIVLSLKSTCRNVIRCYIGQAIDLNSYQLNLPSSLFDYLLLKDRVPYYIYKSATVNK